jgi:hypothetical protein
VNLLGVGVEVSGDAIEKFYGFGSGVSELFFLTKEIIKFGP